MPPMKSPPPHELASALAGTYAPVTVARRWNVPLATVKALLGAGKLDFCQIAGQLRIPHAAVAEYEQGCHADALGQRPPVIKRAAWDEKTHREEP